MISTTESRAMPVSLLVALLALGMSGCATHSARPIVADEPHENGNDSLPPDYDPVVRTGYGTITGLYIPTLVIDADEDKSEPNNGVEIDADLDQGGGWGARIGVEREGGSIGLLYLTTHHSERAARTSGDTHQLFIEVLGTAWDTETESIALRFSGGLGVGGALIDFKDQFDDTGSLAGMIRGELGLRLFEHVDFTAGAAGFLWGYPSETVATGGFATIGCTIRF